ncbi:MAG: DUF1592 domain-containing protein [Bryobacteraceae bacterium]|nr:DUF1592 domain-containing protein [Bryobacteraceae bacterium]
MKVKNAPLLVTALALILTLGWTVIAGQTPATPPVAAAASFDRDVKPFLAKNCVTCHNADNPTAGVRVDHLDAGFDDRHIRVWEGIRHRVREGTMPPKGLPQPSPADRERMVEWIGRGLETARLRPAPKNGLVRRLTVAQYRNTLRDLLGLEDDLTETLPPDAISADGFVNNKETLQLSPLLLEAYLEIAEEALNRAIVDPKAKPKVQNFRMDFGAGINQQPVPDKLILGANSELLENADFTVTQLTPVKPFAFEPFFMRTKYRFIEGYQGNDTVRGWRDFDSIYHAVFACMRGSRGYPKGKAYGTVPEGLLLRPAIPNEELFEQDGTYGPKANFKISLRELPDQGRFRVTVTAAKYQDGLLLDSGVAPLAAGGLTVRDFKSPQTVTIPKAGLYQVDAFANPRPAPSVKPDATRLSEGLGAAWSFDQATGSAKLEGQARLVASPFGQALSLDGGRDGATVVRDEAINVGTGDFTLAAWIRPGAIRKSALLAAGGYEWTHGWYLEMPGNNGILRFETAGADQQSNGALVSTVGAIRPNLWQHVAVVVRRGAESRMYVNGYLVAQGKIGAANLDNPKLNLQLGRMKGTQPYLGDLDDVRVYRRAIEESEIEALIEPGRQFAKAPPDRPQDLTLTLAGRVFTGVLAQPAFVAVRLDAGPVALSAKLGGIAGLERIVITPLNEVSETGRRMLAFEKRLPKLGVHLGLRRDCGSTFAPVGAPQVVAGTQLAKYTFEGAIANYPSPNVEKDNVNYLAGIREIAVRSEYTDGRDMPRLRIRSIEFEGPYLETWPPPAHRAIFPESKSAPESSAYAREVIRGFASRAYRRPLAAAEEAALVAVFEKSRRAGGSFTAAVKDALQVVLTAPQFLFLTETSATPAPEPLDSYELASKLSYFLWNSPPDRATLRLAAANTLPQQLDAEVDRMIADPRFGRFLSEFTSQWLALDKFQVLEPDRKRFPNLTRDVRAQLKREPVEFLGHLIRQNLSVRNLVTSDFVVANEAVASYYDLGSKVESGFEFVAIRHERKDLGGVLAQASILAGLSDGRESNPIKRGAWLARRIIAEPPADPPPNVPALDEDPRGLTLRQRLEKHRDQPGCRQCHAKIDPWGIAFEEYDAGGRWKTHPVEARSTLPDQTEVSGAQDLKRYLSEDRLDQVAFSVLKHLATYANGRSLTYNELNHLKQDSLKLKVSGYRMKDMVRYVASSKLFLEK